MRKLKFSLMLVAMCLMGTAISYGQIITSSSGDVGIGAAPAFGKLDVRGGNIFLSPSLTPGLPSQFIGIGEPGGSCDIYGVRVARLNSSNVNVDRFINTGVKKITTTTTITIFEPCRDIRFDDQFLDEPIIASPFEETLPFDDGPGYTHNPTPIDPIELCPRTITTTSFIYQPIISWGSQGSLIFEYDENPSACGVSIFGLYSPSSTYQGILFGDFRATNIHISSDGKLKDNVRALDNVRDRLYSLTGHRYNFNAAVYGANSRRVQEEHIGFIAQEVQEAMPELVQADEFGVLAVNYVEVLPILTEAYKEGQESIKSNQEKASSLQSRMAALKAKLEANK